MKKNQNHRPEMKRIKPSAKQKLPRLLLQLSLACVALIAVAFFAQHAYSRQTKAEFADKIGDHPLLESRESPYSNIYVYKDGTHVCMTFGLNQKIYTESVYNTAEELELPVAYTQFMTSSLIYPNKINSILEIGSGGGRTAWYLHRLLPNVQITTVELDPMVVDLSKKYFGIRDETNFTVATRDGRLFLKDSKEKYDVILIDAYRGPFVPFHLLTKEFYQVVKDHLASGGVMAQNIESTTMLFDSAVKTVHAVFPTVDFYEAGDASVLKSNNNIVAVAYDGTSYTTTEIRRMAAERQAAYRLPYDLQLMLPKRYTLKPVGTLLNIVNQEEVATGGIDENSKVLTDDFAPVESLKAIERHNQKWTQ